jgi:ubiquinone biosynthesis monooxygenase Coq7
MKADEEQHAVIAMDAGAVELPYAMKELMRIVSQLMTRSSYYL